MAGIPGSGGKKGRSGRKSKAVEMGLVALLDKCWTVEDREKCIRGLARSASDPLSGDRVDAIKLLLAYTFGKPHETITATITRRDFIVDIGGISTDEQSEQFVN